MKLFKVGDIVEINETGIDHEAATVITNDAGEHLDFLAKDHILVCVHFHNAETNDLLTDQWIDIDDVTLIEEAH